MINHNKPVEESNTFIVLDKYAKEWRVAESYRTKRREIT